MGGLIAVLSLIGCSVPQPLPQASPPGLPKPASAAQDRALEAQKTIVSRSYANCLLQAARRLDDGRTPVEAVAPAIAHECDIGLELYIGLSRGTMQTDAYATYHAIMEKAAPILAAQVVTRLRQAHKAASPLSRT